MYICNCLYTHWSHEVFVSRRHQEFNIFANLSPSDAKQSFDKHSLSDIGGGGISYDAYYDISMIWDTILIYVLNSPVFLVTPRFEIREFNP